MRWHIEAKQVRALCPFLFCAFLGCSAADEDATDTSADAAVADTAGEDAGAEVAGERPLILEAARLGLTAYLESGPTPSVEVEDGDTTGYLFDTNDGPLCMRGDPFRFAVRERDPERLVFFLQGGGACWTEFCFAVTKAPAGVAGVQTADPDEPLNPMKDWSLVYLPYCDGSLFTGELDHDDDGDGEPDRFHRGLHNLTGALRTARERFPDPGRVLLVGSSAGGYGTILATVLVRATWPEASIQVFSDSGVGLAQPGDPSFLTGLMDQFAIGRFVPESCTDCVSNGHITPLVAWTLERDEDIRVAVFSAYYDTIIGAIFLGLEPTVFRDTLLAQTGAVHERFPDRYKRFLADGHTHTSILGNPIGIVGDDPSAVEMSYALFDLLDILDIGGLDRTAIGDVTMADWLEAFVTDSPDWIDTLAEPGPPPEEYTKALSIR
jgi:hypothetical protein